MTHCLGIPTEKGLNIDAEAVLMYVKKHPKLVKSPVVLFGRSLGGAVAVSLAHKHPAHVAALVLENTFISIPKMVDFLMPLVAPIKGLVLRIGWDSGEKIQHLKQPILFISGDADELVCLYLMYYSI